MDSFHLNQSYETFALFLNSLLAKVFESCILQVLAYVCCHTVVDLATSLWSFKQNFQMCMYQMVGSIFLVHGLPVHNGSKLPEQQKS